MKYKLIFVSKVIDEIDWAAKQICCDVLILDENGNYFAPQYVTLERVKSDFGKNKLCYLEDNLIILHTITKENIIKSVTELDKWLFYKRWIPLSQDQLEKYFFPEEDWIIFDITI
jgi:hypothetical protein